MADLNVHGPIDFVLIEFPGDRVTGAAATALLDLVDRGIVRVYDLLVVRKDDDGTFSGIDIDDLSADTLGGFTVFSGARSGLLDDDDVARAAEAMKPGTVAALIVYENAWAVPFVAAARDAGGQLVASARIPAQDVMDALDALEIDD
jgi:dihydroorotase-like cyclic amidohydrolase